MSLIVQEGGLSWLRSELGPSRWLVVANGGNEKVLDFGCRLPDGSDVIDHLEWLDLAKDFAVAIRSPRAKRIPDAGVQIAGTNRFLQVIHALHDLGVTHPDDLGPEILDRLATRCAGGCRTLTRCDERIAIFFDDLERAGREQPERHAAVVEAITRPAAGGALRIDTGAVLAACGLPDAVTIFANRQIAALAPRVGLLPPAIRARKNVHLEPPSAVMGRGTIDEHDRILRFLRAKCGLADAQTAGLVILGRSRRESRVTPCPPTAIIAHLVRAATACVTDGLAPVLEALSSRALPWARPWGSGSEPADSLRSQVLHIATAAFILIAVFTARRLGEILDLRADAVVGDESTGWYLDIYINKNLRRRDLIPVPKVVVLAVQALIALSATARVGDDDPVFQVRPDPNGYPVDLHPELDLDDFARRVGTPWHVGNDGIAAEWSLTTRQFRRWLAVLFFFRFRESSLAALAHLLRHVGIERTRGYVKADPEVIRIWREEERRFASDLARQIATEGAAGGLGRRMAQVAAAAQEFANNLVVVEPGRVGAAVEAFLDRGGYVLTPRPWATCGCPSTPDATLRARCRSADVVDAPHLGPDHARATPLGCAACPYAIIMPENRAAMDREIARIETAEHAPGTVLAMIADAQLASLREVRGSTLIDAQAIEELLS